MRRTFSKVEISGWIETSLVDVIGHVSFSVWFSYCNFRCPWCQNRPVIMGEKVLKVNIDKLVEIIEEHAWLVDFLHVTGGEPTLQPVGLAELFKQVKERTKLKTSLSTNGSRPNVIRNLLKENLLDHLAIDVKAPIDNEELYAKVIGLKKENVVKSVVESLSIAIKNLDFIEVRTTLVPGLLEVKDIERIARYLSTLGKIKERRRFVYVVQQFSPSETVLNEKYRRMKRAELEDVLKAARMASKCLNWEVYARTLEVGVVRIK